MARHASTYRQARRAEWAAQNELSWPAYNSMRQSRYNAKEYGNPKGVDGILSWWEDGSSHPKPSKDYRGKLGAKDKARMDRSK